MHIEGTSFEKTGSFQKPLGLLKSHGILINETGVWQKVGRAFKIWVDPAKCG
jgi:hypothetical protein